MTQPNPPLVSVGENKDLAPPGSDKPSVDRTSPMIEKMARAIFLREWNGNDPGPGEWACSGPYWTDSARAALETLLEPTEEMVEEGNQYLDMDIAGGVFTAMIRQALSSAEQTASESSPGIPSKLKITGELGPDGEVREIKG